MRIADVSEFYSGRSGVYTYVERKFAAAARHGHHLTLIAPGGSDRTDRRDGGEVVWVRAPHLPVDRNYRMFWDAAPVWRAITAAAPDLVEGSSPWRGGWLAGHWPGMAARTFVFHQDFVAGYPHTFLGGVMTRPAIDRLFVPYWRYLRRLSARFDATVTGGAWLAQRLEEFGVHRPHAVPFGVSPGVFSPARRNESLRRELLGRCGITGDGSLLLAVGRLHPEKRHRTMLEAFARAREKRPMGLVIVGDGLRRTAVEAQATRIGHVHMAGAVTDRDRLADIYASADLLVHGSAAETYGFAVAEAMLSGLAVVVPDSGGALDLASHGASRVYRAGDAVSCCAAILDLLGEKRPFLPPTGIGSLDDHFAGLFAFYEKLAGASS
jgi:alpha-1,6-mannosyltransferase